MSSREGGHIYIGNNSIAFEHANAYASEQTYCIRQEICATFERIDTGSPGGAIFRNMHSQLW